MSQSQVCVIDDDADCLILLERYLKKALPSGVRIILFKDPLLAQEWLATNSPLILLCDLDMDGIDGFQLLKQLKSRQPLTPVVLITSHGTRSALESAIKRGADDFIAKPFTPSELSETIAYLVKRSARWRSTIESN